MRLIVSSSDVLNHKLYHSTQSGDSPSEFVVNIRLEYVEAFATGVDGGLNCSYVCLLAYRSPLECMGLCWCAVGLSVVLVSSALVQGIPCNPACH